jgi:catechol 2,3-dioxygenase-like lactoylglutathione lyase family enzyme
MKIRQQVVVFDTKDLAAESAFWAGLLGGTVFEEGDWHTVSVDGEPRFGFQLAPDHVRPEWPDGAPQQVHVDFYVDGPDDGHDEVLALGGTLLKPADDRDAPEGFTVYADPAGHPFCLCWG